MMFRHNNDYRTTIVLGAWCFYIYVLCQIIQLNHAYLIHHTTNHPRRRISVVTFPSIRTNTYHGDSNGSCLLHKRRRIIHLQQKNAFVIVQRRRQSTRICSHMDDKDAVKVTQQQQLTSPNNNNHMNSNNDPKNPINDLIQNMGQILLNVALQSPIWKYVMIPLAREKIKQTAFANEIDWESNYDWLANSDHAPWIQSSTFQKQQTQQQNHNNNNRGDIDMDIEFFQNYFQKDSMSIIPVIPNWYKNTKYHAYEYGHLNWNAAIESEIASAAIGARNIPDAGRYGENQFRTQFTQSIENICNIYQYESDQYDQNPNNNSKSSPLALSSSSSPSTMILDIGCATGVSTRWLANQYPNYKGKMIGIDLSPYNIVVAQQLQTLTPIERKFNQQQQEKGTNTAPPATTTTTTSNGTPFFVNTKNEDHHDHNNKEKDGSWISTIVPDERIEYLWMDGSRTSFSNNTVDVVNFQFVAHELPVAITCEIIEEAYRIIKENGQLWLSEMDFQSPGYMKQRSNPLLFALIRSTEPYLDEYADLTPTRIYQCLVNTFDHVVIAPATGRHYTIVATKLSSTISTTTTTTKTTTKTGKWIDLRFDDNGQYRVNDTHLQVWENEKTKEKEKTLTN